LDFECIAQVDKSFRDLYCSSRGPLHLIPRGTAVLVDVIVGGQPLRMLLDTGARYSKVDAVTAQKLIDTRQAHWVDTTKQFKMAMVRSRPRQCFSSTTYDSVAILSVTWKFRLATAGVSWIWRFKQHRFIHD
jgi:hypothetical protein